MGRGRAKAKQTKVARDLKYRTFDTDFSSLERELRGSQPFEEFSEAGEEADEYDDPYAPDEEEDDDEDEYPEQGRNYG
ncbi:DUF3073 domain-containing protein [Propioniciclava sinopodophylli]|jgi:hypothetical protein|uniref:DUF3073 domain-containing protein n=1 Tax=Propioniciclava sinopodophylli TaxID=1837344 RepID=A0A4Q9KIB6_9ACTN|nr:DUF3073 domain-containing protein [Propioniciclava sinopodophylli]TBT87445.1 DUF3073 domain-containing protein [Propioniciclava sinopodophylli]